MRLKASAAARRTNPRLPFGFGLVAVETGGDWIRVYSQGKTRFNMIEGVKLCLSAHYDRLIQTKSS